MDKHSCNKGKVKFASHILLYIIINGNIGSTWCVGWKLNLTKAKSNKAKQTTNDCEDCEMKMSAIVIHNQIKKGRGKLTTDNSGLHYTCAEECWQMTSMYPFFVQEDKSLTPVENTTLTTVCTFTNRYNMHAHI